MEVVVVHDVVDGYECGNVAACFAGEIGVELPEILFATGTGYSLVNGAGATIISGYGQRPIAEVTVKIAQEAGGGIGGFVGIATFIDDRVDLKAVVLPRAVDELPKACGTYTRGSHGIESRFYNGEIFELFWYAITVEGVEKYRAIVLGKHEHDVETTRHVAEIEADMSTNLAVESHGYDRMKSLEAGNEKGVRDIVEIGEGDFLTVLVAMVESAEVVTVDEAVVCVGIAFGHKLDFGGRVVNRVGRLGPG